MNDARTIERRLPRTMNKNENDKPQNENDGLNDGAQNDCSENDCSGERLFLFWHCSCRTIVLVLALFLQPSWESRFASIYPLSLFIPAYPLLSRLSIFIPFIHFIPRGDISRLPPGLPGCRPGRLQRIPYRFIPCIMFHPPPTAFIHIYPLSTFILFINFITSKLTENQEYRETQKLPKIDFLTLKIKYLIKILHLSKLTCKIFIIKIIFPL